jgi:hypothetical protein
MERDRKMERKIGSAPVDPVFIDPVTTHPRAGVSGGEEGARFGPSLMPGGNPDAW